MIECLWLELFVLLPLVWSSCPGNGRKDASQGDGRKSSISGPSPDLLKQNLQFISIPNESGRC